MSARTRALRAENKVTELTKGMASQDVKIASIQAWVRDMKAQHTPYVAGRIDLSTCHSDNLRAKLAEQVGANLYCRTCSTPWPCYTLMNVRHLQDVVRGARYEGLPRATKRQSGIEPYL